jgi:hypothetical protein
MEYHEIESVFPALEKTVYSGEDKYGIYKIWPSAKYPGYFYVDRIMYGNNNTSPFGESSIKPLSKIGVVYWINNYANNIKWNSYKWNGKELNYTDPPKKTGRHISWVYFIEATNTNLVKIGRGCGSERLKSLQTGCPYELKLLCEIKTLDDIKLEKELHRKFNKYHYRGEWFCMSDKIQDYIKENSHD